MRMSQLICGLVAHVDAGKTTLSEALLYTAGAVRKLGRVDHGDAFLDTDIQERERGITIFSKQAMLNWKGQEIVLVDTPGHVDFSSEMERTLQVLDCAVLVINAASGVQGHTLTLWKLLKRYQVPVFLFINKMDMPDCRREKLLEHLHKELGGNCVDMQGENAMEEIAMCSERAMELYLEGAKLPENEIQSLIHGRLLFPCYFGSALKNEGIASLLDALKAYRREQSYPEGFGAKVYKIARDNQGNRLSFLKVTGGVLKARMMVAAHEDLIVSDNPAMEKVNQIRLYSGDKFKTVEEVAAGNLCAVTGLNATHPGQGLGGEPNTITPELTPVFTYHVELPAGYDPHVALQKLRILEDEDPQLHVVWIERSKEIHVQLMGEVQLEILSRMLKDRFSLSVGFGEGRILYLETIDDAVEGVGHYEPLRHYAEVHLLLEKGERGSGIRVSSICSEDELDRNWQRLIITHILEKRHLGVLTGSPITDISIKLIAGRDHLKHTEGGDFRQATYRAIRQGLMQAKSVLLEPWYELRLQLPLDCLGRAINDIEMMGGKASPPETHDRQVLLTATAPVAKARHYAKEVSAYTKGRGHLTLSFSGYAPCIHQEEIVQSFAYDPEADLDNSPDSIFCSHGAGYPVKWNEVPKYMHIDTGILKPKASPAETAVSPTATKKYSGTAEEDRELMAIFERTYGPIKERSFRSVTKSAPPPLQQVLLPDEPEYLLVDGYNVIFAWDELKKLAKVSLEDARKVLIDLLSGYQGIRNCKIILVFDGYALQGNPGEVVQLPNLTVVYTKEAQTADSFIEKSSGNLSKQCRVRVVTSDGAEQHIIFGNGALRVSAGEFHRELEQTDLELHRMLDKLNRQVAPAENVKAAIQKAMQNRKK